MPSRRLGMTVSQHPASFLYPLKSPLIAWVVLPPLINKACSVNGFTIFPRHLHCMWQSMLLFHHLHQYYWMTCCKQQRMYCAEILSHHVNNFVLFFVQDHYYTAQQSLTSVSEAPDWLLPKIWRYRLKAPAGAHSHKCLAPSRINGTEFIENCFFHRLHSGIVATSSISSLR